MGHIFFIMWVSWAWKWTLIENLNKSNLDLHIPLSYKTRQIRENEINGIDANFISKEEFFNSTEKWEFLEYALVHETDYYGTKFVDVIENWINKWKIVIKELDINWLKILRSQKPELDNSYTTIFLNIPNDILIKRIESRWALMTNDELTRRVNSATCEEKEAKEICNYIIDATKNPLEVLNEVVKIIKIYKNK